MVCLESGGQCCFKGKVVNHVNPAVTASGLGDDIELLRKEDIVVVVVVVVLIVVVVLV
jgi:hypothetical protein